MTSLSPGFAGHERRPPLAPRLAPSTLAARARITLADHSTQAMGGVGLLAAVIYLWNLTLNGFANTYYSAAALAASQSWSAWFFGALDGGSFITVDKPPLSTMVMGLSVRLFGLSSWSVLLPEALMGVASVVLLFAVVKRQFGTAAATIAGAALAITPVAALMFRFDNPEAVLTLLLVLSAAGAQRAIENGRHRWLVLAGVATGLAFLAKYFQGFLVGPAIVLAYAVAANASVRRRIAGVAVFGASTLLTAGAWVAAVALTPADLRPYIGGSSSNSVLDLIVGYDGLGRLFGASGGTNFGGGANFSGAAGILRLFNAELGGNIAWLVPFALVALAAGLALTARARRTDVGRAAYLFWGAWLGVGGIVLSLMAGGSHQYYTVILAPAIAALTGAGFVALWGLRDRFRLGGLALAGAIVATTGLSYLLLSRSPDFVPWLAPAVVAVGLASAAFLAVPELRGRRVSLILAGASLVAILAGPGAFTLQTVATSQQGSTVTAGPTATATDFLSGGSTSGFGGRGGAAFGGPGATPRGTSASFGGTRTGTATASTDTAGSSLAAYLVANRGTATWVVAVSSAQSAADLELQTGLPVMCTGGWSGSDNALTLAHLKSLVASGELRYFIIGGQGGMGGMGGGQGGSSDVTAWVSANGTAITVGGTTLYDLGGVVTG
jgi:4-amino-4-deoxy-L-arabinose transferase-like glycosyltransferase